VARVLVPARRIRLGGAYGGIRIVAHQAAKWRGWLRRRVNLAYQTTACRRIAYAVSWLGENLFSG